MQPITNPLNRVNKSPIQLHQLYIIIPPTSRPIPHLFHPKANHQTIYGKSNDSAPSTVTGIFCKPCCKNTIINGILNNQCDIQNSGIFNVNSFNFISSNFLYYQDILHTSLGHFYFQYHLLTSSV